METFSLNKETTGKGASRGGKQRRADYSIDWSNVNGDMNFSQMTVQQLREGCQALGIALNNSRRKAELVKRLEEYFQGRDSSEPQAKKVKTDDETAGTMPTQPSTTPAVTLLRDSELFDDF